MIFSFLTGLCAGVLSPDRQSTSYSSMSRRAELISPEGSFQQIQQSRHSGTFNFVVFRVAFGW